MHCVVRAGVMAAPALRATADKPRLILSAALVLPLVACMVGPDFGTPPAPVAGKFIGANNRTVRSGLQEYPDWWKAFRDPTHVILASGGPSLAALQHVNRTLPIVFVAIVDPVGAGFVDSLARPGGNMSTWQNAPGIPISGGGTWTSYALDTKTGQLYVPGGNPAPDFAIAARKGDNLHTDSVVVLDAKSGDYKHHFKLVPKDWHDWMSPTRPS